MYHSETEQNTTVIDITAALLESQVTKNHYIILLF